MCDIVIRKGPRRAVDNVGGVCGDVLTGIQTVIANDLAKAEVTASTTVAATEGVNVNIVSALTGRAAETESAATEQRPLDERLRAQRKESALNWKKQRLAVLERYTTDKDIAVNSKIMHGDDDDTEAAAKANATQQAKKRLEELDGEVSKKKDEGMSYFSQRDLLGHLEGLSTELEAAWERGEKVKALRFVIQACKLLSVIKVPQCYPSMFILTAKVLDTFGELVYSRIYEKAVQTLGVKKLAKDFKPDDLSLDTKEMCRNWFYKIASIRELVPRVLVELALWRCNRFIKKDPHFFQTSFERFARQVRGIGDPLLAFHARFYVAHKAQEINDEFGCAFGEGGVPTKLVSCEPARLCLEDFYFCIPKISADNDTSARLEHYLKQSQLSKEEYVGLFSPMCRWVVEVIAADGPNVLGLRTLLDQCRQAGTYSIIVQHIINSFDGDVVMQELDTLLEIVRAPRDTTCSQLELLHALGEAASVAAPSSRSAKSGLLATAVSIMSDFDFPEDSEGSEGAAASYPRLSFHVKGFFSSAMAWLYYSLINLDAREASSYLTTIYEVVSSKRLHEKSSKGLEDLLFAVVELLGTDLRGLQVMFGLKSFLSLADLLLPERKRALCYLVLTRYVSHVEKERKTAEANGEEAPVPASSSILVNGLLDMCRSIHYSLSPLTPDEEVTAFSHLLVTFIRTVDYAAAPVGDFEAQLNFLTECRKSFYKSQTVITYVITLVAELIERIAAVSPIKTHSKKSGLFVKVCLVFCHTTICSVTDSVTRAKLFFACGFLALHHGFISHGDLLMEAFADELQVVPPTSLESITQPLFANIQSAVAPDNTGLSIVQLILRVFAEGEAGSTSAGGVPEKYLSNRGRMYCACLGATVALYQRNARAGVFLLDDSQDETSSLHPSNFFRLAKTIVTSIEMEVEKLQAELGRSATPPNMHKTIKKSMSTLLFGLFKALASSCEVLPLPPVHPAIHTHTHTHTHTHHTSSPAPTALRGTS